MITHGHVPPPDAHPGKSSPRSPCSSLPLSCTCSGRRAGRPEARPAALRLLRVLPRRRAARGPRRPRRPRPGAGGAAEEGARGVKLSNSWWRAESVERHGGLRGRAQVPSQRASRQRRVAAKRVPGCACSGLEAGVSRAWGPTCRRLDRGAAAGGVATCSLPGAGVTRGVLQGCHAAAWCQGAAVGAGAAVGVLAHARVSAAAGS